MAQSEAAARAVIQQAVGKYPANFQQVVQAMARVISGYAYDGNWLGVWLSNYTAQPGVLPDCAEDRARLAQIIPQSNVWSALIATAYGNFGFCLPQFQNPGEGVAFGLQVFFSAGQFGVPGPDAQKLTDAVNARSAEGVAAVLLGKPWVFTNIYADQGYLGSDPTTMRKALAGQLYTACLAIAGALGETPALDDPWGLTSGGQPTVPMPPIPSPGSCPAGQVPYNGACYEVKAAGPGGCPPGSISAFGFCLQPAGSGGTPPGGGGPASGEGKPAEGWSTGTKVGITVVSLLAIYGAWRTAKRAGVV